MVDPCAFLATGDPGRFRYAVIEDGQVRVEEGMLGRATVGDLSNDLAAAVCR